jgi:RNA polymerase sigma factor (sigma-70 family)
MLWEGIVVNGLHTLDKFLCHFSDGDAAADALLLQRFACEGDQSAFAALVRRHGPMVLGVAYRVLRRIEDAEDTFQATFMVLARRAKTLAKPHLLANWLYGVAYRTALEATRRRETAIPLVDVPTPESTPEVEWADVRQVLDEEISRLPRKYRVPFVLCYLQGITNEETAQLLGCPQGTVHSRLARARDRLRGRLTRRGVTLSLGLLAPSALCAAGSTELLTVTLRTVHVAGAVSAKVQALMEGVLKAMMFNQLKKSVGLSLITAIILMGVGVFYVASTPAQTDAQQHKAPMPSTRKDANSTEAPTRNVADAKETTQIALFSAREFHLRLSFNHALADEQLIGKRLRVQGYVNEIRRKTDSDTTKYVLHMAIERESPAIGKPEELQFEFRQEDRKALAAVAPGSQATVEGLCTQTKGSENAYFKDCKLIKVDDISEEKKSPKK